MKKAALLINLIFCLCFCLCFSVSAQTQESYESVRVFLPSLSLGYGLLPSDSVIGLTAYTDSSEAHAFLSSALKSPYSFEWTEKYLSPSVREPLVRLFGSWLSFNLPAVSFLLSESHINGDGSMGINARILHNDGNSACMSFIFFEGKIIAMKEL